MNYVNSIKSPATRKIYTTLLRQFLEFCNLRETEELLTRLGDPRQIESRIIDFIVSARDRVPIRTAVLNWPLYWRFTPLMIYSLIEKNSQSVPLAKSFVLDYDSYFSCHTVSGL